MGARGTKAGQAMSHTADRASSPPPTVHASPRLSVLHQTTRNAAAQRSPLTIHRCFQPLPRSLSRAAPGRHRARRGAAITRPLACRREVGQGSGVSWEPRAALVMAEHLGGLPSILLLGMGPLRRAVARPPSPAIRGRSHEAPLAQRSSAMWQGRRGAAITRPRAGRGLGGSRRPVVGPVKVEHLGCHPSGLLLLVPGLLRRAAARRPANATQHRSRGAPSHSAWAPWGEGGRRDHRASGAQRRCCVGRGALWRLLQSTCWRTRASRGRLARALGRPRTSPLPSRSQANFRSALHLAPRSSYSRRLSYS